MKPSTDTLSGEYFFKDNLFLYINRVTESYELSLHSHDFIEFAFVAEGKGFHYMEDEVQAAYKGQLYFIPVGVSHVFRPSSSDPLKEPLVVYNCVFTPQLLDGLSPVIWDPQLSTYLTPLREQHMPFYCINDLNSSIENIFLALHREYSLPQSGSNTYLLTLLLQLLVTIYRLRNDEVQLPLNKPAQFLQVLHFIQQHYADNITLAQLSRTFDWSERHLQRLFHKHTGQTFHHFLQNTRIQKSCGLLMQHPQFSVQLIAEQVGYQDTKTFSSVFKRIVGKTPGRYRGEMGV
ncbi:hypothetical protein GCM10010912_67500 [Paenibacillus albidus]|uniref:HTH araC/xylS-type domain-containing protein n=1 Tax=Paenibacillus albidus TaxID=2041023 RepID=A0A917D7Y3_9BACL|nr:AraC family transcriptional regulator [Paenibacillus albidus]GGG13593.1 hypothetical protein GCM10010912_67500 [Paenibacillus albidus]